MKPNRFLVPLGLLLCFALSLVPCSGQAPTTINQAAGQPWQLGLSYDFTSSSTATGALSVKGLMYYKLIFVPQGTVSGCTLSFDSSADGSSFSTGGVISSGSIGSCASAGSYITPSAVTPTKFARLTPSVTGTGTVTVVLYAYTENPAASSGAASNVTILNSSLPVTGSGTFSTQPSGFGAVVSGQQAVTATAAALASNAAHGVCVKALAANTIDVFVGPTGVTTSTGYPLSAGDGICYQVSNSNLIFVIASTTGASVAWTVN